MYGPRSARIAPGATGHAEGLGVKTSSKVPSLNSLGVLDLDPRPLASPLTVREVGKSSLEPFLFTFGPFPWTEAARAFDFSLYFRIWFLTDEFGVCDWERILGVRFSSIKPLAAKSGVPTASTGVRIQASEAADITTSAQRKRWPS